MANSTSRPADSSTVSAPIPDNVKLMRVFMVVYNLVMASIYLCVVGMMVFFLVGGLMLESSYKYKDDLFFAFFLIIISVLPAIFAALYIFNAFYVFRRSKLNYVLQIVSLGTGFTSLITLIPGIFLLIGWLMTDVREYYWKGTKSV